MKEWLEKLMSEDEAVSTKRVTAVIAFFLIVITVLCNLFFNLSLAPYLADILFYVYCSGLGLTSIEKIFQPSKNVSKTTQKIEIEKNVQVSDKQ